MNADDARKLAEAALSRDDAGVGPLLKLLMDKIGAAARKGDRSIMDPLDGIRTPVSARQRQAVYDLLRVEGYGVEICTDPRDSTTVATVSW